MRARIPLRNGLWFTPGLVVVLAAGGCDGTVPGGTGQPLVVGPGMVPPVVDNVDTFVGKVQDEAVIANPPPTDIVGTGSLVMAGRVLTCAHAINRNNAQHYERFNLNGTGYAALGVAFPGNPVSSYDACAFGDHQFKDVGLLLIPNQAPAAPLGTLPPANYVVKKNDILEIVGYGNAPPGPSPLKGETIVLDVPGPKNSELIFDKSVAGTLLSEGDSGGPSIVRVGDMRLPQIVGVHHGARRVAKPGDPAGFNNYGVPIDIDMSVMTYLDFINGDGSTGIEMNGLQLIDKMTAAANGNWNVAASWARGKAGAAAVPVLNDIAVLDPTANFDANVKITVNAAPPDLQGILNDVDLLVTNNTTLRVTGATGGLNSGVMETSNGAFSFEHSLDNQGLITLKDGWMQLKTAPRGGPDPNGLNNEGFISLLDNSMLVMDLGGPAGATALAINKGTIFLRGGGMATPAAAYINSLLNYNQVTVGDFAGLDTSKSSADYSYKSVLGAQLVLQCTGGLAPVAFMSIVDNGGLLKLDSVPMIAGPVLTVARSALLPAAVPVTLFTNRPMSQLQVGEQSTVKVSGYFLNQGMITMTANGSSLLKVSPGNAVDTRQLQNAPGGIISFANGGVAAARKVMLSNMDFANFSNISGTGTFWFTGLASFLDNAAAPTPINLNEVDFIFDNALANSTFEAASSNIGPVRPGLTDPFAMDELCLQNNSQVKLLNAIVNQGGNEAVYVKHFGVDATSTLDLNGIPLYYDQADVCGGLAGTFLGGKPIPLPPGPPPPPPPPPLDMGAPPPPPPPDMSMAWGG